MLFPFSDPAAGVSAPPGDFDSNYRHLKKLINRALKEGTPIEDLQLVPRNRSEVKAKRLSREDLLNLLRVIRKIRSRYQRVLQCPVPRELERDILAKTPDERLPWETEALEKIEQWREDVKVLRAQVQQELNDHLNSEFFRGD